MTRVDRTAAVILAVGLCSLAFIDPPGVVRGAMGASAGWLTGGFVWPRLSRLLDRIIERHLERRNPESKADEIERLLDEARRK